MMGGRQAAEQGRKAKVRGREVQEMGRQVPEQEGWPAGRPAEGWAGAGRRQGPLRRATRIPRESLDPRD